MKNKKNAKAELPGQFDSNSIALCLSFSRIQEKIQHCSLWSYSILNNSANQTTKQLKFGNEVFLGISTFTYHLMPSKRYQSNGEYPFKVPPLTYSVTSGTP